MSSLAFDWHTTCSLRRAALAFVAVSAFTNVSNANEAYIPSDDSEVLETLPSSPLFSRDQMATIRQRLAAEPENAKLAATAAYGYLHMGKSTGDPRFYGYARAAIQSWWNDADAPTEVLMQRAKIKERDHDYDGAISDLGTVTGRDPQNAQAWIELSNLYRVTGDYENAWRASNALAEFADENVKLISQIPLMAVNGQAEEAYELVSSRLPAIQEQSPDFMPWATAALAQISRALGRIEKAELHYKAAIRLAPDDLHLKRSYAEFLLDQTKSRAALDLLIPHTSDNGALLIAAIAARDCGEQQLAEGLQDQLAKRFEEIRLRDGQPHGRFEARYLLELEDAPEQALAIAKSNWEKQKEARDTRNLLLAAIAADQPAAAAPVLDFLKASKTENVELRKLVSQLEGQQ